MNRPIKAVPDDPGELTSTYSLYDAAGEEIAKMIVGLDTALGIVRAVNRANPSNTNDSPTHTSGPWHIDQDMPTMILNAPLKDATEIIAQTSGEANARLIAAAPELLEALKTALDQTNCDGDLCMYQWHEDARAVIAKAEGRS